MKALLLVFFAGGVGSSLRYAVQLLLQGRLHPASFPWATFAVNLGGCFLIGLFHALTLRLHLSMEVRLLLTTGLCGGFTTFSTFCADSLALLRQGHLALFALYVSLSLILGIIAVWAGNVLARSVLPIGNLL